MKIKFYKLIICLVIIFFAVNKTEEIQAQQDPMYTQYMFNTMSVNPAYAASKRAIDVIYLLRKQWVGIDGAPLTQTLSAQMPFPGKNIGVGLSLLNDVIGPINQTSFYVDFGYKLKVRGNTYFSMGLKGGFNLYNSDYSELVLDDETDEVFATDIHSFAPNFGCGLLLYSNKYYVGIASPKLLQNSYGNQSSSSSVSTSSNEKRHYFIIGGYVYQIRRDIVARPSFLVKYVNGSPISIDASLSFILKNTVWLGAMYRYNDSFGGMIQYRISKRWFAGYAYDHTLTDLKTFNSGSHEFMLKYTLEYDLVKVKSPRYF